MRALVPADHRRKIILGPLLVTVVLATGGCMQGPVDGALVSGNGVSMTFSGVYDSPGIPIALQVLDQPDGTSQWRTLPATIKTSTSASHFPSTSTPYYEWSWTGIPQLDSGHAAEEWPVGGLVRVRAVAADPNGHGSAYVLAVSDEDQDACYGAHQSDTWAGLVLDCGKDPAHGAAIAAVSPTPAESFSGHTTFPPYLTRKQVKTLGPNETQLTNTDAYYSKINAPKNLTAFKQTYGFSDGSNSPVSAIYYNFGDLGIGRNMNCGSKNGTIACYVSNYAPADANHKTIFGDENNSLALATGGGTPFATVAMVYTPPITSADSIKFIVYGSDQSLADSAQLDSRGFNTQVPTNCLSCHGGTASYDGPNHSIKAANTAQGIGSPHFLAFDVFNSLDYGSSPYTYGEQAEKFRKLNELVLAAGATPAMSDFLTHLYPTGIHTVNAAAQAGWVPTAWSDTAPHAKLYSSVVAPYCRTCHLSNSSPDNTQSTAYDWSHYSDFAALAASIGADVCGVGSHVMPHAEQTLINMWNSPARAHLTGLLGIVSSCQAK